MRKVLVSCGMVLMFLVTSAAAQESDTIKGIELYRAGNYADAITVLQKVVDADPKARVAWQYLGGALLYSGNEKEAGNAFKNAPMTGPIVEKFDEELKITRRKRSEYTEEARANRVSGTVTVLVEFKSDGTIGFVFPLKTLTFGLTESAVASAKFMKFVPTVKDGKPVTVIRLISYSFNTY